MHAYMYTDRQTGQTDRQTDIHTRSPELQPLFDPASLNEAQNRNQTLKEQGRTMMFDIRHIEPREVLPCEAHV